MKNFFQRGIAQVRTLVTVALLAVSLAIAAPAAFALPPDFTSLTTAIDMSTTSAALLLAASALIGVYILWKGANMIMGAFKGR